MAGLLLFFIIGGFVIPSYVAPALFEALSIPTSVGTNEHEISLRVSNRNINHGETFQITASNPAGTANIAEIHYSCSFSDITISYFSSDGARKEIPCDTTVHLPAQPNHTFELLTGRRDIAYIPLTIAVSGNDQSRDVSFVLAATKSDAERYSRLADQSVITLQ